MEQLLSRWGRHEGEHAASACRFTKDRHIVGVTTEACRVVAHPLQRGELIEQANVIGAGEAERTKPIVDGHHHTTARCKIAAVIP